ncbi:hypothetical protein [Bosea robiniae]|uniref:Uncharacterized protein n=1 Tax=Bosea robiniae TaxID=1036780 RepID=A0ABY0PFU0_9HYPH|nr:hypothetical protein [Bosea robiniae]SDH78990.1 hypothetical protein SAMN05421844_1165 [Bosea robiniae]
MRALPAAAMAAFRADAAVRNQQDAETAADVPMAMAYLDRCGATFEQVPGYPTWFAARWEDSRSFDEPRRWACCIEEWDREHHYAKAFRARVEMQEGLQ